jgi:hypothetical protein
VKKPLSLLIIAALAASGALGVAAPAPPAAPSILYHNAQYDFTFSLPASWRGYAVLSDQWEGENTAQTVVLERGPIIVLRNPQWKPGTPTQDIPILVFTRHQWDQNDSQFSIFAGGVEYEIAHNFKYVFAIWSRFNVDDSVPGWKEADTIVQRNIALNGPNPDSR